MGSFFNIRVASLNCRGINDRAKRVSLFNLLADSNYTIILLQETKIDPSQHHEVVSEWKRGPILLNSVFGKKCGTAVLFNTLNVKIVNDIIDQESRIISVDFEMLGSRFHLVNSYFPNDGPQKYRFIQSMYKYVMSYYPVIWGGDFNLTTDNKIDRWPPKPVNDSHSHVLERVLETFNLEDCCRVLYPDKKWYTYKQVRSGECSMSRIDKILSSKHFKRVAYSQEDGVDSDHEIIMAQLQYQSIAVFGKGLWRNNTKYYKGENFLEDFKMFWNNLKATKSPKYYGNFNKWWNECKYDTKVMLIQLGKKNSQSTRREIGMMKNSLDQVRRAMTQYPWNKIIVKQYFEYKNKIRIKQLKHQKEKLFKEDVNKFLFGDSPTKEFFETFKRRTDPSSKFIYQMKNEKGSVKTNTKEILEIGQRFYQNLFSVKNVTQNNFLEEFFFRYVNTISDEFSELLKASITVEEIWDAIVSFIEGKTSGQDGLGVEFYKTVFSVIKDDLVRLFNSWFEGGFIPAKNLAGLITLIPKKELLDDIVNYRPINLLNVDLKIYTKILCSRLKPMLGMLLHDTQFSQPGKNIGQLVTLIRDLRDDMCNSTRDSFLVSIDFMKAFDNVDHGYIVKLLNKMKFPKKFIDAFQSLYKNAQSKLMINGMLSKRISIKSGIRQGDPLSKDIFTLSLNPLIVCLNENVEVMKYDTISRRKFSTLAFVDDVNMITRGIRSVFRILELIDLFGVISGFRLNFSKTEGFFQDQEGKGEYGTLPPIKWVENMEMLGIHFGKSAWEAKQWESKFIDFKRDVAFFKSKSPTFDGKAMLSKFKLCSIFSYIRRFFQFLMH